MTLDEIKRRPEHRKDLEFQVETDLEGNTRKVCVWGKTLAATSLLVGAMADLAALIAEVELLREALESEALCNHQERCSTRHEIHECLPILRPDRELGKP